jgi:hypothetical protein
MLITENIDKKENPFRGLTFKIERTSFGSKGPLNTKKKGQRVH